MLGTCIYKKKRTIGFKMGNSFSLSSYMLVIKVQRRKDMKRDVTDSLKVVHPGIHYRSGVDLKISLYISVPSLLPKVE
jgi:hypothetical protein